MQTPSHSRPAAGSTSARLLAFLVAVAALVSIATTASAARASGVGVYEVRSIVLTYASTATTQAAVLPDGRSGTMTTTVTARLEGAAGTGGPSSLSAPEVPSQYLCSPSCPSFRARGTVKVVQTFVPAGGKGPRKTCVSSRPLKPASEGAVAVQSAPTSTRRLEIRLQDSETANALYEQARGSCALPAFFPLDSSDVTAFGTATIPTSRLGARTIAVTLRNTLKPPSYPWAATGRTTVTATLTLARKS